MPLVARFVKVAHSADAHDVVPVMIFLKYIEHLFLLYDIFQLGRVLTVGHSQQQSVVVFHYIEQLDISCAWH